MKEIFLYITIGILHFANLNPSHSEVVSSQNLDGRNEDLQKTDRHRLLFKFSVQDSRLYEIQNAVSVSIPQHLELRNERSIVGQAMNEFRDNYNKNNVLKIGKSNLVFPPYGTNDNVKAALSDATRITIAYYKVDEFKFPKSRTNLSSESTPEMNEFFRSQTIKGLNELPFETKLIKWNPIKTGFVSNQCYFKTSCIYEIDGKKAFDESYHFFNGNEKVILSIITDYPTHLKWTGIFLKIVSSFTFKNKM